MQVLVRVEAECLNFGGSCSTEGGWFHYVCVWRSENTRIINEIDSHGATWSVRCLPLGTFLQVLVLNTCTVITLSTVVLVTAPILLRRPTGWYREPRSQAET